MKSTFLSALFLFFVFGAYAQTRKVSGVVKDANGETIISASVVVKGTTIGTVTDFDGAYSLQVPADAKTLVFSYIGMTTVEKPITSDIINVTLKEDAQVIEEVVVTGYGTTKKRDLVTSVASVSAEQLKDIPVTNAAEALQGKLSGVSVTTTEGSPDAEIKIRVRGGTSLTQSNEPLYIVDGFPVSSINDIPPSDIESMDVLKDAAATAIYGAQGANGVIIITTKDADTNSDKMTFHVDYTGYVGWKRMAKKYDMLDNREFALLQYEYAYLEKGQKNLASNYAQYFDPNVARDENGKVESDATLTPIADVLSYWESQPNTDWQRKTFGPTWGEALEDGESQGFNSNHSFSVSGGNKNASFNLSYNRIDDKGIMYGSDYDRNNISFKGKFKPIKNLTLSFNARYSNTNIWGAGANTADDAGSKTESRVRNAIAYTPIELIAKDNSILEDYDSFGSLYDPITTIDHNYRKKKDDKWTINGYASYKFAKKFTLRTEVGYEGRYRDDNRYYGPTTYYSRDGDGKTNANNTPGLGHVVVTDERTARLRNTNTFEYKDEFGDGHNFSLLLGEEQTWNRGEEQIFYGYGYETNYTGEDVFNFLNQCLNKDFKNTIASTDNMLSFFGRANYDYLGRYYLTATMRADASTRFTQGNQWGYFPSVAVAWRMSDESWMVNASDWLSNLKLRFSYGTAGNNNVDTGYLFPVFSSSSTTYMSDASFSGLQMTTGGADKIAANNNLKWETTVTRDFGIDYGFFNERLSGAFDLYWNTTNDLIIKYKTSVGGYNYQYRNIGSTRNRGLEFSVRGIILDHNSKSLSYGLSVDANISFNENVITSLGGMETYPVATDCFSANYKNSDQEFLVEPGQSMGRIYGFVSDGWYTAEDFAQYDQLNNKWLNADGKEITTLLGNARPGMMKLKDLDGKDGVTADDRTVIGCTLPLFTGGFNISAHVGGNAWGRVDLNANFTYSYGNDVLNLSALDYTTIFDKSKLRNNTVAVAHGQRYSMFGVNGDFIPASAIPTITEYDQKGNLIKAYVTGDNYTALAAALNEANANASIYNPVMTNIALTDQFVEDGSYLRLSNLTIGYSLPQAWLEKAKISNVRIFVQGTNLFCATKYSGSDPEVDTRSSKNPLALGVDFSAYPKARGFNVGLNLSF